jgi:acetyl/propionyl-CoA carboxylase alpha subunit
MRRALDECVIAGIPTTIPFHRWALAEPGFKAGRYSTGFVAERWETRRQASRGGAKKGAIKDGRGRQPALTLALRAALAAAALETWREARRALPPPPSPAWKRALGGPASFTPSGSWSGRRGPA